MWDEKRCLLCYIEYTEFTGQSGQAQITKGGPSTDLLHLIKEMIRRGYPDKQFATMDAVLLAKDGQMKVLWEDINPDGGDRMYSYLLREALPWMERHGVAKEDACRMVCDNAVRLFR